MVCLKYYLNAPLFQTGYMMNNSYGVNTLTSWMDHTWWDPHADCAQQCVTSQKVMLLHLHGPHPLISPLHRLRSKVCHTPRSTQMHSPPLPVRLHMSGWHLSGKWTFWLTSTTSDVASSILSWIQLQLKASFDIFYVALVCSSGFCTLETLRNHLKSGLKK